MMKSVYVCTLMHADLLCKEKNMKTTIFTLQFLSCDDVPIINFKSKFPLIN